MADGVTCGASQMGSLRYEALPAEKKRPVMIPMFRIAV
jgi:hypothetical protein